MKGKTFFSLLFIVTYVLVGAAWGQHIYLEQAAKLPPLPVRSQSTGDYEWYLIEDDYSDKLAGARDNAKLWGIFWPISMIIEGGKAIGHRYGQ